MQMAKYKLVIENKQAGNLQFPSVEGELTVTWSREGSPGKLICNIVKDESLNYQEGNTVAFYVDDELFFYGYVFEKSRAGEQIIKTTCYDQIRYLKNKSTLQYKNWSYSELLKNICADRHLAVGEIEDTGFKIPARAEINQEYYQMLKFASDITTANTNKIYVLFDKGGKICLKDIQNMKCKDVIDYDCTLNFDYATSISEGVYNRVYLKLLDDDKREVKSASAEDGGNIAKWGILQYFDQTNNEEDIEGKAKELLKLLNKKHRRLKLKNIVGRTDVRAGSLVPVDMPAIGDIDIKGYMMVASVTHKFQEEHHFMDMEVYNKDISPVISQPSMGNKNSEGVGAGAGIGGGKGASGAIKFLQANIGAPYSQAQRMSPGKFDCSSAVMRAYQSVGLLPTKGYNLTTSTIASDKHFMEINRNQLQPGDVCWKKGHMEMYVGGGKTLGAHKVGTPLGYSTLGNRFNRFYRIRGDS